jgi:hypothetical protein
MAYDDECEELARHFLPAGISEDTVKEFAQYIQDQIELWIDAREELV